jgi:hypothetical protein
MERMAAYEPEQLGFLGEVSKDERTPARHYGRSRKGRRAVKKQVLVRGRCTSTEALLTLNGIVAGTVVKGSMTKAMYMDYLAFSVVSYASNLISSFLILSPLQLPQCFAFPGLLNVLVMDNAKIHHRQEILDLVAEFGIYTHWFLCCFDC